MGSGWVWALLSAEKKISASARNPAPIFRLSSLLTRQLSCTKMGIINSDTGSIVVKLCVWHCTYSLIQGYVLLCFTLCHAFLYRQFHNIATVYLRLPTF